MNQSKPSPSTCIHCGSSAPAATKLDLVTARRVENEKPGASRPSAYTDIKPLTLSICDDCIRKEAIKIKKRRGMRLIGFLISALTVLLIVAVTVMQAIQSQAGDLLTVIVLSVIFTVCAAGLGIKFINGVKHAAQNRGVDPKRDPIETARRLFDEHDGLMSYFRKDLAKAVRAASKAYNPIYWTREEYEQKIKPNHS